MEQDDFINMEDFLKKTVVTISDEIVDIELEEIQEKKGSKMYQLKGKKNCSAATIHYIGNAERTPFHVIHKFKLKTYDCLIISYILSDADIDLAQEKCSLKMIGIIIQKNDEVKAAITMSFYTFVHHKEKKSLHDYVLYTKSEKKSIEGFFGFELKYPCTNDPKNELIKTEKIGSIFKTYPGKTKSLHYLIHLLSNVRLLTILKII